MPFNHFLFLNTVNSCLNDHGHLTEASFSKHLTEKLSFLEFVKDHRHWAEKQSQKKYKFTNIQKPRYALDRLNDDGH